MCGTAFERALEKTEAFAAGGAGTGSGQSRISSMRAASGQRSRSLFDDALMRAMGEEHHADHGSSLRAAELGAAVRARWLPIYPP